MVGRIAWELFHTGRLSRSYPVIFIIHRKSGGGGGGAFCSPSKKVARVHLGTLQLNGLTIYLRGCSLADTVLN
jgi:hypothetical protein